jgi:hypothetical protein
MPSVELQEVSSIVESLEKSNPTDAYDLIKTVEKESRRELGTQSIEFFSRSELIQSLVNIGGKYITEEAILEYVVRTLKTIAERCPINLQENQRVSVIHDPRTQEMYEFLFNLKDSTNKKIKMLVAYTIPFFPQFDEYKNKWEYILSIPRFSPKKESMNRFRMIIEYKIGEIPNAIKDEIVVLVNDFLESRDWHKYTRQLFIEMLEKLR